jgi:hypothetical protein
MFAWPSSLLIHSIGSPAASACVANVCPHLAEWSVAKFRGVKRGEHEPPPLDRPRRAGEGVDGTPLERDCPQGTICLCCWLGAVLPKRAMDVNAPACEINVAPLKDLPFLRPRPVAQAKTISDEYLPAASATA